jgi:hypothetical protein
MRTLSRVVLAALAALTFVVAIAHAEDAAVQRYGAKVTAKKPVDIAALAQTPEKFNGKTIRLEGTVKDVCQGMGCWVEVADAKGASFIARSLDEKILLPKDCKGRKVVVQGVVQPLPTKAKEEKPADGHACPKPEYVVATTGVELASK